MQLFFLSLQQANSITILNDYFNYFLQNLSLYVCLPIPFLPKTGSWNFNTRRQWTVRFFREMTSCSHFFLQKYHLFYFLVMTTISRSTFNLVSVNKTLNVLPKSVPHIHNNFLTILLLYRRSTREKTRFVVSRCASPATCACFSTIVQSPRQRLLRIVYNIYLAFTTITFSL